MTCGPSTADMISELLILRRGLTIETRLNFLNGIHCCIRWVYGFKSPLENDVKSGSAGLGHIFGVIQYGGGVWTFILSPYLLGRVIRTCSLFLLLRV